MIIVDASPIILLGKQGALELLKKCFGKILISKKVYEEVMKKKDNPETLALGRGINDKWVIVKKVNVNLILHTKNLGQGEKEAISLAYEEKRILLTDDDNAKKYASLLGIESHGTLYVIYLAVLKRFIDKGKAKEVFESMIKDGFYMSTDVYARFLDLLNKL